MDPVSPGGRRRWATQAICPVHWQRRTRPSPMTIAGMQSPGQDDRPGSDTRHKGPYEHPIGCSKRGIPGQPRTRWATGPTPPPSCHASTTPGSWPGPNAHSHRPEAFLSGALSRVDYLWLRGYKPVGWLLPRSTRSARLQRTVPRGLFQYMADIACRTTAELSPSVTKHPVWQDRRPTGQSRLLRLAPADAQQR